MVTFVLMYLLIFWYLKSNLRQNFVSERTDKNVPERSCGHETRVHWPTAGVHRLSLYLVGTPVFFELRSGFSSQRVVVVFLVEDWFFESKNAFV